MLSIGEFSKICGVSKKTLRYYDEIGLIYPDEINPQNSYRYYSLEQLKKMLFINRLKSYQFSLDEIKKIVDAAPDDGQDLLCSMLYTKRNELIEQAKILDLTLKHIHDDITHLEEGSDLMSYLDQIDVQLVQIEPMHIVSIREKVTLKNCNAGYGPFFSQVYHRIVTEELSVSGKPMTIYHSPEYTPNGYDIEFAIPVQENTVSTSLFQSNLCVKSVLKGHYSALPSIYAKQHEWAQTEGYKFIGAPFEIYITDPYSSISPEDQITEIYYPIKPIS